MKHQVYTRGFNELEKELERSVQVASLLAEEEEKKAHVVQLEGTTKKNMWRADLDEFEAAYNEWLAEEWAEANKAPGMVAGKGRKKAAPKKKVAKLSCDSDDWGPATAAPKKKAAGAAAAPKKVTGPAYGSTKAAVAKATAGEASTSKGASASKKKAATGAKDLKLADVFAKAATKKKAARPREEDSFTDSPVCCLPVSCPPSFDYFVHLDAYHMLPQSYLFATCTRSFVNMVSFSSV